VTPPKRQGLKELGPLNLKPRVSFLFPHATGSHGPGEAQSSSRHGAKLDLNQDLDDFNTAVAHEDHVLGAPAC
jgi:hypothetical protein